MLMKTPNDHGAGEPNNLPCEGSDALRDDVRTLIAGIVCCPPAVLTDAPLAEQGADSLDFVEIAMVIEDCFGVTIEDDELPGLKTVDDFERLVASRIGEKANG